MNELEEQMEIQLREFFAGGKFPKLYTGPRVVVPQRIPDELAQTIYFVSFFDEVRNIPYFSAYKVTSKQAADIEEYTQPKCNWRTPVQLAGKPGKVQKKA